MVACSSCQQRLVGPSSDRPARARPGSLFGRTVSVTSVCREAGDAVGTTSVPTRMAAMSTISRDEVARVAALARIDLRPEELDRLSGELDVIVDAIAKVSEVATPDVPATSHPIPMSNVFRDDIPEPPLPVEDVLAGAPAAEDGRFSVPQILGEE